jgi:hypothetical protein
MTPVRSGSRLLLLLAAIAPACASAPTPAPDKEAGGDDAPRPERAALALLDKLAGAMRNDLAERLVDVADPVNGVTFWGQPGACASPLFRVSAKETGPLTALAKERIGSAPPHYFDRNGYWREVAETIRSGLRVVKLNRGHYELPPEEKLDRAPAWASLDTRNVALGDRQLSCLSEEEAAQVRKTRRADYRYRFRAERGYSSVTVFLIERDGELRVEHVIQVWHYDA